jgi:hypothetical protein
MPTVEITIPVPDDVADKLATEEARRWAGEQVASLLRAKETAADDLYEVMERIADKARASGLTPEMVEEELAAYKASRT